MAELKPCPFCGATQNGDKLTSRVALYKSEKTGCIQVHCFKCNTTSDWYDTERQAVRKWNTRTPQKEG